jgi:hypothetical protein
MLSPARKKNVVLLNLSSIKPTTDETVKQADYKHQSDETVKQQIINISQMRQ